MPIQGFQLVFRADSGCSPIRMTAADCCNGDMSNANNNPQGGSAWFCRTAIATTAADVSAAAESRQSILRMDHSSRMRAAATGGSPRRVRRRGAPLGMERRPLVRALVILTSLLFGAGRRSTRWPGSCYRTRRMAGCCARRWSATIGIGTARARAGMRRGVALCLPGAGWLAFGMAVLVFWLLVNRQSYAASWQPPRAGRIITAPGQPAPAIQPGRQVRPAQSQYATAAVSTGRPPAGMPGTPGQPMPQPAMAAFSCSEKSGVVNRYTRRFSSR